MANRSACAFPAPTERGFNLGVPDARRADADRFVRVVCLDARKQNREESVKKSFAATFFVILLSACSTGIVSVGGNRFACQNLGRTRCKFSVTQYSGGMPIETVEIEVKGGSISATLGEILSRVAAIFGGTKL